MKKNILVVFVFATLFIGCFSSNNSSTEVNNQDIMEDKITEEESEFIGTYDSKTGVMTDISCYCFQTGYFTTESGEDIVICFKDGMEEATCSENLKIKGYFENITITPEETSPCGEGERELFFVTSFECM